MTDSLHRQINKQYEQEAINKISLKYLDSAKKKIKRKEIIELIDESAESIKQGTSNVTYEELDMLSRVNDDERISVRQVFKLINCTTYYFISELKSRLRKFIDKGDYSKVDVLLEIEKNRLAKKDRKNFSRKII